MNLRWRPIPVSLAITGESLLLSPLTVYLDHEATSYSIAKETQSEGYLGVSGLE